MRLVKISAPLGKGAEVARVAFSVGIQQVTIHQVEAIRSSGERETKDAVDLQTSTPKAKKFVDALLKSDFYNSEDFSINTRQPRSIISRENLRELTKPLVEPVSDIQQELWQFSHITTGFVGRIFIAACLLAYGLIHQQTLILIAGLLFLPLLPLLLAVGFGAWTRQWKLAGQGALAFSAATGLLILGGLAVSSLSQQPIKYDEFNSLTVSFLISLAVGIAAGLANIDDVGRRELIGLAATAQIAVIPVWFGICFVFGFPTTASSGEITEHAITFLINTATIIIASLATYVISGAASRSLDKVKEVKS
jgi:hypothetical protein